jgi:hypothetical protein
MQREPAPSFAENEPRTVLPRQANGYHNASRAMDFCIYGGIRTFERGLQLECKRPILDIYVDVRDDFERDSAFILNARDTQNFPLVKDIVDPTNGEPYFFSCKQIGA